MQAVNRLNMLRPEFVMSIGDLIEGGSEDVEVVEGEWAEFLAFVDKMQMKFFFVAGNHDLSNPLMHDIWRKHFGPEWYSFDYKQVHFVCLCTEDPVTALSDRQITWLEKDLTEHADARWTLLFMHKPLWSVAERELAAGNPDPTGWTRVVPLVRGRPHTFFAGHTHNYVQFERHGMKYYQLATTGGSSQLRGLPYGEFDHVVWLTMESDGPHVANLLLEGIQPGDVVTEQDATRFRQFLTQTVIDVAPVWVDSADRFRQGRINLHLTNGFDQPVVLNGAIHGLPLQSLTLEPERLELSAVPGETARLSAELRFGDGVDLSRLNHTSLTAKVKTTGDSPPLAAEWTVPVVIDHRYPIHAEARLVDADLDEWGSLRFATNHRPTILDAVDSWQGPADASFSFDLAHDGESLTVAAEVTDDRIVAGQDRIVFYVDARPPSERLTDQRLRTGAFRIGVGLTENDDPPYVYWTTYGDEAVEPAVRAAARRTGIGYVVEFSLPLELLETSRSPAGLSLQMAVALRDTDDAGQPASVVLWRGTPDVDRRNTNYGQFIFFKGSSAKPRGNL
jgi:hypothetical protein